MRYRFSNDKAKDHAHGPLTARSSNPKGNRRPSTRRRPHRDHGCWDHLIVAPLWVAYEANLGTLLRTCDATGACMAVVDTPHYRQALNKGDTLPRRPHLHWIRGSPMRWLYRQRERGTNLVAVELADRALPLTLLETARQRTVILLGHERHGVPPEVLDMVDQSVEIPMIGRGASLNVAVAGSLVLYRLAGLS